MSNDQALLALARDIFEDAKKPFFINPEVIEGLKQRGIDVDSEKTKKWLESFEPGSGSWPGGPYSRAWLIEGATEHPVYSLDRAAKAIRDQSYE